MVTHTIHVDPDITISELIDSWQNGNLTDVINALSNDHAGLAAVLLVQGLQDGRLTQRDANTITNLLLDRRITLVQEQA